MLGVSMVEDQHLGVKFVVSLVVGTMDLLPDVSLVVDQHLEVHTLSFDA